MIGPESKDVNDFNPAYMIIIQGSEIGGVYTFSNADTAADGLHHKDVVNTDTKRSLKLKGWLKVSLMTWFASFPNSSGWQEQNSVHFKCQQSATLHVIGQTKCWGIIINIYNQLRNFAKKQSCCLITTTISYPSRRHSMVSVYERDYRGRIHGIKANYVAFNHGSLAFHSATYYWHGKRQSENAFVDRKKAVIKLVSRVVAITAVASMIMEYVYAIAPYSPTVYASQDALLTAVHDETTHRSMLDFVFNESANSSTKPNTKQNKSKTFAFPLNALVG